MLAPWQQQPDAERHRNHQAWHQSPAVKADFPERPDDGDRQCQAKHPRAKALAGEQQHGGREEQYACHKVVERAAKGREIAAPADKDQGHYPQDDGEQPHKALFNDAGSTTATFIRHNSLFPK
ncbi:MAG: hypothetical protein EOP84_20395 [Verrucomicrobiaceae bacterium]|nr:MAG: hypothetical protein EOP84_20395 [Verrucomicrobiaceae bacterium]